MKIIFATAFSVLSAAGTPFVKVAIKLVVVQVETGAVADLKTAFAVHKDGSGKPVPVKVIELPTSETELTVGDPEIVAPNLQRAIFTLEQA